MTLVMDGVRRSGFVPSPPPQPVRRQAPVVKTTAMPSGVIGMDGIRRHVPSPRELLATMQPAAIAPSASPAISAPSLRDWHKAKQVAAFGLVATALVTAGVATGATTLQTNIMPSSARVASAKAPVAAPKPAPAAAPAVAAAPASSGLQDILNGFVAGQPGKYGIVVKNLSTGETASINPDTPMESASLYKLFAADAVYSDIEHGRLSPGQAAGGATNKNISECLTAMITISDNDCGQALGTLVGWGNVQNPRLSAEGYKATDLNGVYPKTSPTDVATLFERLYSNSLNSPSSNAAFLDLLKAQQVNDRLPVGLPSGTVIAHKTGNIDGYVHDAGIIYGPKANFLVVVMSGSWDAPGSAPGLIASLSQQLWTHLEQ